MNLKDLIFELSQARTKAAESPTLQDILSYTQDHSQSESSSNHPYSDSYLPKFLDTKLTLPYSSNPDAFVRAGDLVPFINLLPQDQAPWEQLAKVHQSSRNTIAEKVSAPGEYIGAALSFFPTGNPLSALGLAPKTPKSPSSIKKDIFASEGIADYDAKFKAALEEAKNMWLSGNYTNNEIRLKTGWDWDKHAGSFGGFNIELPDPTVNEMFSKSAQQAFKNADPFTPFSVNAKHPSIYNPSLPDAENQKAAISALSDVQIEKTDLSEYGGLLKSPREGGSYFGGSDQIEGHGPSIEALHSTILHEMQHHTANKTGGPRGSNDEYIARHLPTIVGDFQTQAHRNLTKVSEQLKANSIAKDESLAKIQALESTKGIKWTVPEWKQHAALLIERGKLLDEENRLKEKETLFTNVIIDPELAAWAAYRFNRGEVQARNVQNRRNLTPEERAKIPPSETETFHNPEDQSKFERDDFEQWDWAKYGIDPNNRTVKLPARDIAKPAYDKRKSPFGYQPRKGPFEQ